MIRKDRFRNRLGFIAGRTIVGLAIFGAVAMGGTGLVFQNYKARSDAGKIEETKRLVQISSSTLAHELTEEATARLPGGATIGTTSDAQRMLRAWGAANVMTEQLSITGVGTGYAPPASGGAIPTNSKAPRADAFGRPLGYCAWHHGDGSASSGMIAGRSTGLQAAPLFAVMSAGPDGVFQTTCGNAAANQPQGDDIVQSISTARTIELATAFQQFGRETPTQLGSANLQGRDVAVGRAVPGYTLDVAGAARSTGTVTSQNATVEGNTVTNSLVTAGEVVSGSIDAPAGSLTSTAATVDEMRLVESPTVITCGGAGTNGRMRYTAASGLEVCNDGTWAPTTGGGGGGIVTSANLGNLTNALPSTTYTSNTIWVAGFPTGTAAVLTSNAGSNLDILLNGTTSLGSSTTLNPFTQIALRVRTSATYGTSHTVTLTVANQTLTWTIDVRQVPTITMSAASQTVTEGSAVTVSVSVSHQIPDPITLNWDSVVGTAQAADWSPASGTLAIPANTSGTRTFTINTTADTTYEAPDETFTVRLQPGSLYTVGSSSQTVVTIWDNDHPWSSNAWGSCSNSCGSGTQTRTNSCPTGTGRCDGISQPSTSQSCTNFSGCSYSWQAGGWGGCSASCGGGWMYRSVWCQRSDGTSMGDVSDVYSGCHSWNRPGSSAQCNTHSCCTPSGPWYSCDGCSASCGGGGQWCWWSDGCSSWGHSYNSCNTHSCGYASTNGSHGGAGVWACSQTTWGWDTGGGIVYNGTSTAWGSCASPPPTTSFGWANGTSSGSTVGSSSDCGRAGCNQTVCFEATTGTFCTTAYYY